MAFDEGLGERVRALFDGAPDVTERRMFGGLAFMVAGNMACGIIGDDLLVRVARDDYDATLALPHARRWSSPGARCGGSWWWTEGIAEDDDLDAWVDRGVDVARTLPPK